MHEFRYNTQVLFCKCPNPQGGGGGSPCFFTGIRRTLRRRTFLGNRENGVLFVDVLETGNRNKNENKNVVAGLFWELSVPAEINTNLLRQFEAHSYFTYKCESGPCDNTVVLVF